MKRLFRLNDLALTEEILRLLASNPYRDDASKPYESRWSLVFLIDEVLKAPEDYLRLSQAGWGAAGRSKGRYKFSFA